MTQSVKLVGITRPTDEMMTTSDLVAYCARVSNPSNQDNKDTAQKLIDYLIRNKHWSPLEMVSVVMEIDTTRDIARQILRHRSFSFQEFSQRYADPRELGFDYREARLQDQTNRQNSIESDDDVLAISWARQQAYVEQAALTSYKWALDNGIAKEQARAVLPEGMMMSRMYMNGTLRSWLHYIELRIGNGTQKEHREIAAMARDIIANEVPAVRDWLNEL